MLSGLRPENFFLTLAIFFGLVLSVVTAPFQSPDEPAHLQRIWQLSEGHFLSDHYGGVEPTSINACFGRFLPIAGHGEIKTNLHAILQEFHRPLDSSHRQFIQFANTAIYSPVPYIPQTIACFFGRIFLLPPIALMYLGRFANVFGYAAVGWLAIRTLPILKWPACLVLVAPLPIFLAGSLSADPMTIALAFLATSAFVRLIVSVPPVGRRMVALLFFSLVSIALCKWVYFTVVILMLNVPRAAWGQKWRMTVPVFIAICALNALAFWSIVASPMHVPLRNGDPGPQIIWLKAHPLEYVRMCLATIRIQGLALILTSIGALGWVDLFLPWGFVATYMAITLWAVLNDIAAECISVNVRLNSLIAAFLSMALIVTCDFLVWNVAGNSTIEGLQGRYFLPLALLVFIGLHGRGRWKIRPGIMQAFMVLSCTYTVGLVIFRYYF